MTEADQKTPEHDTCIKCLVFGKVQGVFFRASTQKVATELGLVGYAKNMPDGSVEVLACGDKHALESLNEWLWVGPAYAKVSDVKCEINVHVDKRPDAFGVDASFM